MKRLLERPDLRLRVSVSATTRAPRPGEQPGRDYFVPLPEEFEAIRGQLLESAEVHGHSYGTPAEPVRQALAEGICVILVIDVQGGSRSASRSPARSSSSSRRPSLEDLERRLRARGTDDEATIRRRLANARRELEMSKLYDVHVINDDLDRSVDELAGILVRNHCGGRIDHDR